MSTKSSNATRIRNPLSSQTRCVPVSDLLFERVPSCSVPVIFLIAPSPLEFLPGQLQEFDDQLLDDHDEDDQLLDDHDEDDQLLDDQLLDDQEDEDQLLDDHDEDDQLELFHVPPNHAAPDHDELLQSPPDQLLDDHEDELHELEFHGLPNTSTSTGPLAGSSLLEPRAAFREPSPVETGHVWTADPTHALLAARMSIVPRPSETSSDSAGRSRAVERRTLFTWSGVKFGRSSSINAAAPETTAAACEVPLPRANLELTRPAERVTSI